MKQTGKQSLTLFNAECELAAKIRNENALKLYTELGLAVPTKKMVASLDLPLIPQQEDFYFFPFRHLSQTIVGGHSWKATDFSEGNVLQKSTKFLRNKKAYINHDMQVGKEIGYVGDPVFSKAYSNDQGIKVPPGIDAPFVIDSKLFPDFVRKMSSPVSPIDSASVTVIFEWEASHDFEHDGDFFWHLGEMVDDTMVRRIVVNIQDYEESSLVWCGADPYAKMLNEEGKVININRSEAYEKAKMDKYSDFIGKKYYVFDCLDTAKLLHLTKSTEEFSHTPKLKPAMDKELLQLLASLFNTTPEKIEKGDFKKADAADFVVLKKDAHATLNASAAKVTAFETEKTTLTSQVTTLTQENTTLKSDKTRLEGEVTSGAAMAKVGKTILDSAKVSAKKFYGIFAKGKPEQVILDEISAETDIEKLNVKMKMWGGKLVTDFSATCGDCKSSNVVFRSSVPTEEGEEGNANNDEVSLADHFAH